MPIWIASALTFARKVPREVWIILAALAVLWWHGNSRYHDGREAVLAELREAEDKAEAASMAAVAREDKAAAERAEIEAETRARDIAAIEAAEAAGGNALDGLF
jgi:hypothetical protein